MQTLDTLTLGQTATIIDFTDDFLSLKFIEMGCLPGEKIKLSNIAPLGDPIAIEVSGYLLSLRKKEAATIVVKVIPENTVESCVI
ncbi:MAG: Fe2+ transport system protein [Bacteroidetes bacterium]|jgi:ferrous iron transport protein A|nr:Fe2+ transport system protein [Bacteroidota bacterium]MDF2450606.1 Fe2+ transport system protein [Bacteroidota bacterium]